jgi:ATP:ADP antiporter, AAA family
VSPKRSDDVLASDVLLSIVSHTKPRESITAILLTIDVFLLLCAYYLLKVAREPLILLHGGAEVKSYAAGGQAALLVLVTYAYNWLARRMNRLRLMNTVTLFFVVNLLGFAALAAADAPIGVPFYLWVGIFNLTMVAQFWSFAADIYDEETGKRMFPILGVGSSVGAVAGSSIADWVGHYGESALMLGSAALILVCLGLTVAVDRREARKNRAVAEKKFGPESGFTLLLRDRYLILIGVFVLVFNFVNNTGEYILDRTLTAAAAVQPDAHAFVREFKASYFSWYNGIGVALQVLVVSRIIRYLGVRVALFIVPAISLLSYGMVAVAPVLTLVFVAKIADNSLDYSLQNTARNALWLVAGRDAKYKAKQVVDTFLVRFGDVLAAGMVFAGSLLGFATQTFAVLNVALVVVWLLVLIPLARVHRVREAEAKAAAEAA